MKIIALATCHNRRELTLRSLKCLHEQSLHKDCNLEICIVDDGSTDGTAEAVKSAFPDVKVLEGTGDLYWAGGMRFGWDNYVKDQDFDYLLVFNDDIVLYPGAIQTLLDSAKKLESDGIKELAVAGAFKHPETGETTYGGVVRSSWWHPLKFKKITPTSQLQKCATINMNCTLISKAALDLVGFLLPDFVHKAADFDFGLRLTRAGGFVALSPDYVGECETNAERGSPCERGIDLGTRWTRFFSPKGGGQFQLRLLYYRRHAGFLWALFLLLSYAGAPIKLVRMMLASSLTGKDKIERRLHDD